MFTIMRDPVTLPSSRVVIDRSTIKSHLLSDSKDPFNRAPMAIEEVVPSMSVSCRALFVFDVIRIDVELKAQIDEFIAERRNRNRALDKVEEEIVKMDVSMD